MPSSPDSGDIDGSEAFTRTVRARSMVRSFSDQPVDPDIVERLIEFALGGPSAGNARSLHVLVLDGADVDRYWDVTLTEQRRLAFEWPGLWSAPILIILYVDPESYLQRYSEPDKAHADLGGSIDRWPVPYWWVDGGAAVQSVLLGATAHGLGACFFGQFDHEFAVRAAFGVPEGRRAVGTIAIGHRNPAEDRPSVSGARGRSDPRLHAHRGHW